jgi:hypothetical protein
VPPVFPQWLQFPSGNWSLQPVAIGAAVEVTKPSKPSRNICRLGDAASRQAVRRAGLNREEFDAIPFPDINKLSDIDKAAIQGLATRLQHDARKPWSETDELVFRLYGMGIDEVQVATDTLFTTASYRKAGRAALETIDRSSRDDFVNALREELEPYFDVCGDHCRIEDATFQPDVWQESWYFLAISLGESPVPADPDLLTKAMGLANRHGSSRIMVHTPGNHGLLLGLLNRKRWWTITRARLCAQHIIRDHIDAFGLTGE